MVNITDKVSNNEDSISTNIPSSLGTASQVLAVNSGATATEWVDAAGGSTTKISTTEITSSVANVNITIPTTGYNYVYLHLEGVHPVNDGVYLELKSSLDGGSTFENVTYSSAQIGDTTSDVDSSTTDLRLNYANTLGNAAREDISGFIYFSLRDAADTTNIQYNIGTNRNTGQQYGAIGYAKMQATGHINSIRLEASSGNLVKGKITLYGVA